MDLRLNAMIALAHLRLRQDVIRRYPHLLEQRGASMDTRKPPLSIPRPVELFGMRARLLRAEQQKRDITLTGKDYDEVMDGIDAAHKAIKCHVGDLKSVEYSLRSTIESMIDRSNGAPTVGESDGRQLSSGQGEQGGTDKTDEAATAAANAAKLKASSVEGAPIAAAIAAEVPSVAPQPEPEHLTVNGVQTS